MDAIALESRDPHEQSLLRRIPTTLLGLLQIQAKPSNPPTLPSQRPERGAHLR